MSTSTTAHLPHLHILCMHPQAELAWQAALERYGLDSSPHVNYTMHDSALSQLPGDLRIDAVVSPANSYALLDGGFDDAISRAFSPLDDYAALTRVAQARIYATHRGFLPPGQCQIVSMPKEWRAEGRLRYHDGAGWGCRYLILCPTMRMPGPCGDPEMVYSCVWSLLNAVQRHNDSAVSGGLDAGRDSGRETRVESLLMTPLGTGFGKVSYDRWARQTVLAMKHWLDSAENPDAWKKRNWVDLTEIEAELRLTHEI